MSSPGMNNENLSVQKQTGGDCPWSREGSRARFLPMCDVLRAFIGRVRECPIGLGVPRTSARMPEKSLRHRRDTWTLLTVTSIRSAGGLATCSDGKFTPFSGLFAVHY